MKRMAAVALSVLFLSQVAMASESVSLYFENDFVHQRDQEYTHGTKLTYARDDGFEFSIWQGIYTPHNKKTETVQEGDRPYAGWLAFGVAKEYEWKSLWHVTEFSAGVVGPSSFSEETQVEIHRLINSSLPNGWDDQLDDEPAMTLRHESRKAFWLFGNENVSAAVVPQAEVVIGTVMDYAGAGGDVIFGHKPNPYARMQIATKDVGRHYSYWGFAGVRGRAVAWNMLLDGNMYHDSPSVDKEVIVGDFQCGLCLSTPWFLVTYTDVTRSKEFETQEKAERFGSMMLTVFF